MLDRRTGTLRMVARRGGRQDRKAVLLLPNGKLPQWVRPARRMDVVNSTKSRCLLQRLLHCEHCSSLNAPEPAHHLSCFQATFSTFCLLRLGLEPRSLRLPAQSPTESNEIHAHIFIIYPSILPVFFKILSIGVFIDFTKGSRPNPLYILYMLQT